MSWDVIGDQAERAVRRMPKMARGELLRLVQRHAPELSPELARAAARRIAQDYEAGYSLDAIAFDAGMSPGAVKAVLPATANPMTVAEALEQRVLGKDDHLTLAAWAALNPARLLLSAATASRMILRESATDRTAMADEASGELARARRVAQIGFSYLPTGVRSWMGDDGGGDGFDLGMSAQECHLLCHAVMGWLELTAPERSHLKGWRWHVVAADDEPEGLKAARWRFLHAVGDALVDSADRGGWHAPPAA